MDIYIKGYHLSCLGMSSLRRLVGWFSAYQGCPHRQGAAGELGDE